MYSWIYKSYSWIHKFFCFPQYLSNSYIINTYSQLPLNPYPLVDSPGYGLSVLWFFFLVLTISLFSSMDDPLLVPKRFRSMPLHASSSWHISITYMPSTSCSPSLSHAYYLMPNDLIPCLSLIIYTLFIICTPCLFCIIYIHTPYAFHTLTMLFLVYKWL